MSKVANKVFGFVPSELSAEAIAQTALATPLGGNERCLVITPNIDQVAWLRRDPELVEAYRAADILTCDGWPVSAYARLRGVKARRVTGYDIVAAVMRAETIPFWHRFFFVVDSEATEAGVRRWAEERGLAHQVVTEIPPYGFLRDAAYCDALVRRIGGWGTTILMLGISGPTREVFGGRYKRALPPCWTFCVGQAVMVEAGTVRRAPVPLRHTGLEWAWRVLHEPRRMGSRYAGASLGFALAVAEDLRGRPLLGASTGPGTP